LRPLSTSSRTKRNRDVVSGWRTRTKPLGGGRWRVGGDLR
jgi:hypothetical protein